MILKLIYIIMIALCVWYAYNIGYGRGREAGKRLAHNFWKSTLHLDKKRRQLYDDWILVVNNRSSIYIWVLCGLDVLGGD